MNEAKEKLIELLKLSDACLCDLCGEKGAIDRVAGVIADNLLANGVTIQKWIPVTERLPEYRQTVVVCVHFPFDENARRAVAPYTPEMQPTFWERVTHWMPLPEAPKEP